MQVITRQQAHEQGLPRYFTGKPCKRGHIAERLVSNWTCAVCADLKDKEREGTPSRLASRKRSYYKNQETINKKDRERGLLPHRLENSRKWKDKNREYHNASSVAYTLNRLQADPIYRLQHYLRRRVQKAVKAQGVRKCGRTNDVVGCNAHQLKQWLEQQFVDGMCWENYGEWHVDHIRPCASFDLSDPSQQRECFHFTNLQPLWAADNLKKSDNLNWAR